MSGVDFEKLRRQITLAEVLEALGFTATTGYGDQAHGPCPVHGSRSVRSRRFSANLHLGRYHCHKCHSHGNALELWGAVRHLPLYDAAVHLATRWAATFLVYSDEAPVLRTTKTSTVVDEL